MKRRPPRFTRTDTLYPYSPFFRSRLAVPLRPGEWLAERRARLDTRLKEFGRAARTGTIPGGIIENGKLHIDKEGRHRSEEHTSELQSPMRNSYAVFCLKKQTTTKHTVQSPQKTTHINNP